MDILFGKHFTLSAPFLLTEKGYISRNPIPVTTYGNISRPFSASVWALSAIAIATFSFLFMVSHRLYSSSKHLRPFHLARKERAPLNFVIFPFAKITEPDPLPWFRKWSAGKLLVLLWSTFSLTMILFYCSNLRVHFVTVDYESPIDTLEDVVKNNKRVYLFQGFFRHRFVKLQT